MGLLVALEGIDGSGKGTQAARLQGALTALGRSASLISFPQYQATRFGRKIADFLNGRFGELHEVHPTLVSLLFAGDRFETRQRLLSDLEQHEVVICDRYVASNVAHQCAKADGEERTELLRFIEFVEYEQHQMPPAELTIWFDVPVDVAQERILRKQQRDYTDRASDLQEADGPYLERVRTVYRSLADEPTWRTIPVIDDGRQRSVDEIGDELLQHVLNRLT